MKLQLIETKKASGDYIYLYDCKDDGTRTFIDLISFGTIITREEAIKKMTEVMGFYMENRGIEKVIKEFEYSAI
jgi:hypothetical protein